MSRRCRAALIAAWLGVTLAAPVAAQVVSGLADATWAFSPEPDAFKTGALLDLRELNEKVAGQSGYVRVGADGGFVRGDGQPLRFWAVNTDVGRGPYAPSDQGPKTAPDLARHARFLAKRGVNMVRLHRLLAPNLGATPDAAVTDINVAERDGIWRTVAAMRKEGIYSTISIYWASTMKLSPRWGVAGGAQQSTFGLMFFDPVLQTGYKAWLKKLLTERNPYTGISLADDPGLALIQLQNEDSLLFWTLNLLGPAQRQVLEARFGAFLASKYGSIWNAQSAWSGERVSGDAPDAGRMALLNLADLTQPPASGGRGRRQADQTEFFGRTMHDFNASVVKYLRTELGVKQLINAGNWKTASPVRLGDTERWSYTATDVDASNAYTGGIHQGPNNGWAIMNGDRYTNVSVLKDPRLLAINLKQTQGRPMLVTEGGWIMPNAYAAEGPFLIAAYQSLTGIAGYYWFSTSDEGWSAPQSANGYLPSQAKWIFATPDMLGTFPAAALAYRLGYIRRGTPVLVENRALQDLWDRKTPILAEETTFDPNRDSGEIAPRSAVKTRLPPEAFLVGPALVNFGADPAQSRASALRDWVSPSAIRADTGQIVLNPVQGWCTIDTAQVQGVAAHFADAPTHQLADVRYTSGNAFGAAMAVSLDGQPLRTSRRILLQYGTRSRPTGWLEAPVQVESPGAAPQPGYSIRSYGHAPWQVERAVLDVTLRNAGLTTATVLDMNGMPVGEVALRRDGAQVSLHFPPAAMYVILR